MSTGSLSLGYSQRPSFFVSEYNMLVKLILLTVLLTPALAVAAQIRVFVSVLPQKTFVEKIGGDHVTVTAMVRKGHSPATYEPTPRQIGELATAALYVRIGVPFEEAWMARIRSANPVMHVLDAREGIDLRQSDHRDHSRQAHESVNSAHQHGAAHDPHVWTSPPLVIQMAGSIRDALSKLDPANAQKYAQNHAVFTAELTALDNEIRTLLKGASKPNFMVFHPSWGHFADTYGLTQIPIEFNGKQPGARALTALIARAKQQQVSTIFVQPQFDSKSAQQLARAIGARVVIIDPLSPDYLNNLRNVARQIAASTPP